MQPYSVLWKSKTAKMQVSWVLLTPMRATG